MREQDAERVGPMLNPPHLGELVRESMDDVGWTVTETAARLNCERGTLSRFLNGHAGLSANMAMALEDIGWGTADHWMRMQAAYELAQARRQQAVERRAEERTREETGIPLLSGNRKLSIRMLNARTNEPSPTNIGRYSPARKDKMTQIPLSTLAGILSLGVTPHRKISADMKICKVPDPYVPPTFRVIKGDLHSEVIIVRAPAAVGKSVTARYLSSTRNTPLLNLAEVAVGTGSLQGLVTDYSDAGKTAFHSGRLPIILDALDEGRLLSGEKSFEAFLSSTIAFLRQDRTITKKPKLILLGREESAYLSSIAVELEGSDVAACTLQLDFFEQDAASELIDLYAAKELDKLLQDREIEEHTHSRRKALLSGAPMREVKDAYFSAIARALQIEFEKLWTVERGYAFAGYAPVLASIGTLLAAVDNPIVVTNRLKEGVTQEAWDVIDTVIQEILKREKMKLVDKLENTKTIPENTYDPLEQLAYLTQLLGGATNITLTDNVKFEEDADRTEYAEKVSQICREHPFIRSGKMANEVLGATTLAYAICTGIELDGALYLSILRDLSRSPFLWRSVRKELLSQEEPLLDGNVLGYVLDSYWNDPMEKMGVGQFVQIKEIDEISADVGIGIGGNKEMHFAAIPPVTMYATVHNCEIEIPNLELVINGATLNSRSVASVFKFQGNNSIYCGELTYDAKSTDISGSLWLDAPKVVVTVREPEIQTKGEGRYGWGEALAKCDPWTQLTHVTLSNPYNQTKVARLISDCRRNISSTGIVLMQDYSIPEGDDQLNWTKQYGHRFSSFIKLLVERNFAERELVQSRRRENKFRIRMNNMPWDDLLRVERESKDIDERIRQLAEDVREMLL